MHWVLDQDKTIKGIASVMVVPDDTTIFDWQSGARMDLPDGPLTMDLASTSGDFRGDIIGGLVTLYSDQLLAALNAFGVDNVQSVPVGLRNTWTDAIETGYSLINIVGLIECVSSPDLASMSKRERPSSLEHFSIDPAKTHDLPIFRLAEKRRMIIVSQRLRDHLAAASLSGVRLVKTEDYTVL